MSGRRFKYIYIHTHTSKQISLSFFFLLAQCRGWLSKIFPLMWLPPNYGNILNKGKDLEALSLMWKFLPSQMGLLDVLVLLDTSPTRRHWLLKDGLIELLSTPQGLASMLPRYENVFLLFFFSSSQSFLMMRLLGGKRCAHATTQQATAYRRSAIIGYQRPFGYGVDEAAHV